MTPLTNGVTVEGSWPHFACARADPHTPPGSGVFGLCILRQLVSVSQILILCRLELPGHLVPLL